MGLILGYAMIVSTELVPTLRCDTNVPRVRLGQPGEGDGGVCSSQCVAHWPG